MQRAEIKLSGKEVKSARKIENFGFVSTRTKEN